MSSGLCGELVVEVVEVGEVVLLDLRDLEKGPSCRQEVSSSHVRALAAEGVWPPILVMRGDHTIVDGVHRVCAARLAGHSKIACRFFDGSAGEAFVESVRLNGHRGLPLTVGERRAAAVLVLEAHPEWSDRAVGSWCGIDPVTVARVRESGKGCSTGGDHQLNRRRGLDGRLRPVDPRRQREDILSALEASPGSSAREIARAVGAAPATVSRLRKTLTAVPSAGPGGPGEERAGRGFSPDPGVVGFGPDDGCSGGEGRVVSIGGSSRRWGEDVALRARRECAGLAEWLDVTAVDDGWLEHVGDLPLSRLYELADEARRRSIWWGRFADALEARTRPHPNTTTDHHIPAASS